MMMQFLHNPLDTISEQHEAKNLPPLVKLDFLGHLVEESLPFIMKKTDSAAKG